MSRVLLDNAVKDDLEENGPSAISAIAARLGYPHGTIALVIKRLIDDGVLYCAAVMPGRYRGARTPVYWFSSPPVPPPAPDIGSPAPRMVDMRLDPITRLALVLDYRLVRPPVAYR